MSQMERLYWIDEQIRNQGFPYVQDVRERFGVSERTVYADHKYLRERLNAPLVFDRERRGWTYSDPTYRLPFLLLTDREGRALRRALLAAREYAGPGDTGPLNLLAERLDTYLPDAASRDVPERESVRGSIHLSRAIGGDLIDACDRAVHRRGRLRLLYYTASRDDTRERVVHPYALLNWRGEPHLIAWDEWRQAIRQFFLGRVRQWEMLSEEAAFTRDPGFDLDAYLARGLDLRHGEDLVTVRVRFTPYQARWVRERRYHESQINEEQPDGGLLVTLRVAGTEEVRRWVLGYGAEAEVLEPLGLRAALAEEAKKLAKIYDP